MKRLATAAAIVAALGSTAAVVQASGSGWNNNHPRNAPKFVYKLEKPGCGPDKTDGVAGNSGQHTGQPPKAPDRKDCPNPPGQNK